MSFQFDPQKSLANRQKHGKSFDEALALWQAPEATTASKNLNSGEQVYMRAAVYQGEVWGAFFVVRGGAIRILSFRRLNGRERKKYGFE